METIERVCKFVLCVLLTQFGKTFTAIGRIEKEIERDKEEGQGRSIHLVWTMNTLLNNSQFSKRLNTIEREYGKGSVVVLASKYEGAYTHVKNLKELLGIIVDFHTCPRVVVMCSNDVRYSDGFDFINILNSNTTNIIRVFAYYDELHKYINDRLREQIEGIDKMDIVKGILALTATPDKILLKTGYWQYVRMINLDLFKDDDYAGYADMDFVIDDTYFPKTYKRPGMFDLDQLDNDTVGFVTHVLEKNPDILAPGSRTFIPAHKRRTSHQRIRKEIFRRCPNAVVVLLNGEEKNLKYNETGRVTHSLGLEKTIQLESTSEEVCETIARVIKTHKLEGRPLVITGFLCVGMGQTLIHENLGPFTSAILSHLDLTNDDIYQLFGRVTARSKKWAKYIRTNVYCPTLAMHRITAMEQCARHLAKDHNGEEITEDTYRAPLASMGEVGIAAIENIRVKKEKKEKKAKPEIVQNAVSFSNKHEVDIFLTGILKKPTNVNSYIKKDGYTLSTRLNTYYHKKKEDLVASDRLTMDFFNKIKLGMNISAKEDSGQQYMVYPVYPTMESGPDDFKYYVRYLKPSQ